MRPFGRPHQDLLTKMPKELNCVPQSDVSSNQEQVDCKAIVGAGKTFAFARATILSLNVSGMIPPVNESSAKLTANRKAVSE